MIVQVLVACAERDLSRDHFACDAGGLCPADTDAGQTPLARCAGEYAGTFTIDGGGTAGAVVGRLETNGALSLTFVGSNPPDDNVTATAVADADGCLTATDRFLLSGSLDFDDCTGLGAWQATPAILGSWDIIRR